MKPLILFLFMFFVSQYAFAGTCTSDTYTSSSANAVLTSAKYNSDHSTIYDRLAGNLDGGCVSDGTLELAALNASEFPMVTDLPREGCEISKSDAATVSVDKCSLGVNGNFVQTSIATTVTWGCTGCSAEAASTVYYLYAKNGSSGTTLTLLISTTAPNGDGYDASNNRILGRFYNDDSSDISADMDQWSVNGFDDKRLHKVAYLKDVKAATTNGGTCTSGSWQTRTLNTLEGDSSFATISANVFTLLPGKYLIEASAPAGQVDAHKAKLVQDPGGTPSDASIGTSEYSQNPYLIHTTSKIRHYADLGSSTDFSIQHRCTTTVATVGFGADSNFGVNEVYTIVKITKLD